MTTRHHSRRIFLPDDETGEPLEYLLVDRCPECGELQNGDNNARGADLDFCCACGMTWPAYQPPPGAEYD